LAGVQCIMPKRHDPDRDTLPLRAEVAPAETSQLLRELNFSDFNDQFQPLATRIAAAHQNLAIARDSIEPIEWERARVAERVAEDLFNELARLIDEFRTLANDTDEEAEEPPSD
jgi:hypothetical protein